jgi:hypothetical protein
MSQIPVTINAIVYPKGKSGKAAADQPFPATIVGQAWVTGLGVGGGPVEPPVPVDPPTVPVFPAHPIVLPPLHPEHPIVLPPTPPDVPIVPSDPKPPPPGGGWGWSPDYGWGYFPGSGGAQPH